MQFTNDLAGYSIVVTLHTFCFEKQKEINDLRRTSIQTRDYTEIAIWNVTGALTCAAVGREGFKVWGGWSHSGRSLADAEARAALPTGYGAGTRQTNVLERLLIVPNIEITVRAAAEPGEGTAEFQQQRK